MSAFGLPSALKTSGLDGIPVFNSATGIQTDPGNSKQILTFTVPAGKTRTLHTIYLSCTMRGKMIVKSDGVIIGIARTAPGKPDINFPFYPGRAIAENKDVTITFIARSNSPIVDCDVFTMSTDK
jgi:hypothetical protein